MICNIYYCTRKKEETPGTYVKKLLEYGFLDSFGLPYREEEVGRGKYGKPFSYIEGIHFNISHGQYLAALVCADSPVGIDVESPRRIAERAVQKSCTKKELEWLGHSGDRMTDFLRLWTLKESYVKMVGEGLRIPLREVEFFIEEEGGIRCNREGIFRQYSLEEGVLSLCIEDTGLSWWEEEIKVRKMTF